MSARKPSKYGIDAQYGDILLSYTAGSFRESAVAAYADNHVGTEIISVKQFGIGYVQM